MDGDGHARAVIGVVEAAYRPAADERTWLDALLEAAAPLLDDGLGLLAYRARRAEDGRVVVEPPVARGARSASIAAFAMATRLSPDATLEHAYFRSPPVAAYSEVVGAEALAESPIARTYGRLTGIRDFLTVRGVEPDGHCVVLGAPLRSIRRLDDDTRVRLEQLGAHLAAAARLRRRADARRDGLPAGTEAVVAPGRGVVHAEGDAVEGASIIAAAAESLERSRGKRDGRALAVWTALVQGTWSVVEHFEGDGRRFLVARRNPVHASEPAVLSERERQVVCLAVLGHSQKLVAYELGLAASTVGTLERRAMRKLGVRTRAQLVTLLSALATTHGG
ncbi:MAG: hypothetical protein IT379_32130 [Deltaproteobacteria bacterium]|nr:hypothetical protein [Deltaproteobacteria bacterium]